MSALSRLTRIRLVFDETAVTRTQEFTGARQSVVILRQQFTLAPPTGALGDGGAAELGAAADRLDLLAIVEAQIEDVYCQLDKQMKQTSQLQAALSS